MNSVKRMVLAALFLAFGMVLPFLTGQIPTIGSMLLPMHIPVLVCGFVCGWQYGMMVGFIVPLFRSVLFAMPPMMPTAAAMAFELATYGLICGLLYHRLFGCKWLLYDNRMDDRALDDRVLDGRPVDDKHLNARHSCKLAGTYLTLIIAMIGGRVVWGIVSIFLYGVQGNVFSWQMFMGGALLNAIPGIVLQLVIIPVIVMILERTGLMEEYAG